MLLEVLQRRVETLSSDHVVVGGPHVLRIEAYPHAGMIDGLHQSAELSELGADVVAHARAVL